MIENKNYIHVQSTLPFYDEDGFYIVPASHKLTEKYIETSIVMGTPNRRVFKNEKKIPLKAGDLILFNPLIIHRGTCKGRIKFQRAHIHMRFSKIAKARFIERSTKDYYYYNQLNVKKHLNENWKKTFEKKLDNSEHWRNEIIQNKNQKFTMTDIIINRIKYNVSKFIPLSNRKIENIESIIFPYLK